jgi:hypothetical protein
MFVQTSITRPTMIEEDPEDAENERPPIVVVDKRISARGADATPDAPTPEPSAPAATPRESAADERIWTPRAETEVPTEGGAGGDDEARRIAQQIVDVPSEEWIVNVAVTLANVAGAKLDAGRLDDAQSAIDALAGLVNAVGDRLAGAETPLRQTLAELQMVYAQRASGSE